MKTKKEKVVKKKPNIKETETTKPDAVDMDRNCEFSMRKIPVSQGRIERIKDKLRVWLDENPEAKSISKFYYEQDLSKATYYRLLERDSELAEIHEMVMRKMGDQLWENSVDCRTNWNAVKFKIHQFAEEYKQAREYEAQLSKREEQVQQGPQFIVIDSFKNPEVKE